MKKFRDKNITEDEEYSSTSSVYRGGVSRADGGVYVTNIQKLPPPPGTPSINRGRVELLFAFGSLKSKI